MDFHGLVVTLLVLAAIGSAAGMALYFIEQPREKK